MNVLSARPALRTALVAMAAACAVALVVWLAPGPAVNNRERAIDAVSRLRAAPSSPDIVVVDIDARAEQAIGRWPWPREKLAELVGAVAAAKPAAIGLDIVLSGNCGEAEPGNVALADAIGRAPVTLGFVMSGPDAPPAPRAAVLVRPPVAMPMLWRSEGAELPCPIFADRAAGLASLSLSGDGSAMVRTLPALVALGRDLHPGLAVDAMRLKAEAGTLIVSGAADAQLAIGDITAHPDKAGELRFHASDPSLWAARTVSAADVLAGKADLSGRIVLIGSSLAQLGISRPTAATPLAPSVQIHADAVSGLLSGSLPRRPASAPLVEILMLLAGAAVSTLAALRLKPAVATAVTAVAVLSAVSVAVLAYHGAGIALDPLFPALGIAAAGIVGGLSQYSASRAAETAIRASFEQRLPAALVAQLVKAGASQRLKREERIVTALFTDIEGFTTLTDRAGRSELARLLDGYYEGVTGIVTAHGGMVDKIVGDAVHAFFNVPLALPGHEAKALACAEAILAFSEDYRNAAGVKEFGFGRTRIGVETGPALVGDVGSQGKFDYSAHGNAVNLAARLQDANKRTGTSILAGPGLVAASPPGWRFESRGQIDMAGFGPVEVFVPERAARS